MSEEDVKKMKIENLILKLNNLGIQKQEMFDNLWELERRSENMRLELVKLIENGTTKK